MLHRLARPPIVEALLDFRVDVGDPDEADARLEAFADALAEGFPKRSKQGGRDAWTYLSASQLRLQSADRTRAVIASPSRVTYSATFRADRHYTSWPEDVVNPAFEAWRVYQEVVAPRSLVGLATRYVNRLPVALDALGDVLRTPPALPLDGAELTSFSDYRTAQVADDLSARLRRRALSYRRHGHHTTLLLDVEAFLTYEDAPKPVPLDANALAPDLDRLDDAKNRLFFGTLTDAALSTFA